jgi:hypothetical protein
VTAFDEVGDHGLAHDAQTDESHVHFFLLISKSKSQRKGAMDAMRGQFERSMLERASINRPDFPTLSDSVLSVSCAPLRPV